MTDNRARNRALARYLLLPTLFLTVALLGGLRVAAETRAFVFVAPPLVALVLAVLLVALLVRGQLIELRRWLSGAHAPLANLAHALTLGALFFASAQVFNSVLPEAGLPRWLFSAFFLWALWTYLFAPFDARRLLRSLGALFGTAFVLKHVLLAALNAPAEQGWLRRAAGALLEGLTLGALDAPAFAPATGYISFFTLLLYVGGLMFVPFTFDDADEAAFVEVGGVRGAGGDQLPRHDNSNARQLGSGGRLETRPAQTADEIDAPALSDAEVEPRRRES